MVRRLLAGLAGHEVVLRSWLEGPWSGSRLDRLAEDRQARGMQKVAAVLVGLVAAIHAYILVLEMFLWNTPRGHATFGTTPEFATQAATLAANQGLYNGFLAAGLIWGLIARPELGRPVQVFFLMCVLVAGLYGGMTVKTSILFVQSVPAALALAAVMAAKR